MGASCSGFAFADSLAIKCVVLLQVDHLLLRHQVYSCLGPVNRDQRCRLRSAPWRTWRHWGYSIVRIWNGCLILLHSCYVFENCWRNGFGIFHLKIFKNARDVLGIYKAGYSRENVKKSMKSFRCCRESGCYTHIWKSVKIFRCCRGWIFLFRVLFIYRYGSI